MKENHTGVGKMGVKVPPTQREGKKAREPFKSRGEKGTTLREEGWEREGGGVHRLSRKQTKKKM